MRGGVAAANEGGSREAKSKGTSPVGTLSYLFGGAPFPPFTSVYRVVGKRRLDHLIQLRACLPSGAQLEAMFPPHPFFPMRKDICQLLRPSQDAGLGGGATLISLQQVQLPLFLPHRLQQSVG